MNLDDLLQQLEAAVQLGDRQRAQVLEREILRSLALESAERSAVERQVRDLMARLDRIDRVIPKSVSRGSEPTRTSRNETEAEAKEGMVYPVWFGTNRKPERGGLGFGNERHPEVTRGRVDVHVPEAHRFGETGNAWWKRLLRRDLRDDRLKIQALAALARDAFFGEVQAAMDKAREHEEDGASPQALFFLHGFNVTFEEAAIRAAQIGVDLKVPGATALFSWPSRGTVAAYPADEATIGASERAITEFLVDFTPALRRRQGPSRGA